MDASIIHRRINFLFFELASNRDLYYIYYPFASKHSRYILMVRNELYQNTTKAKKLEIYILLDDDIHPALIPPFARHFMGSNLVEQFITTQCHH